MSTGLQVWLDGTPADFIAKPTGLRIRAGIHGCETASWSMQLPPTFSHPLLRKDTEVRVRVGGGNYWAGRLSAPTVGADGRWSFAAKGYAVLAGGGSGDKRGYLCLDGAGNATSVPDTAIYYAFQRGWKVSKSEVFSTVPFSKTAKTRDLNYVGDLLDAWATSESLRWGVDGDLRIWALPDPTTPTWYLTPGTTHLSWIDDEYASAVYVRYQTGPASYATAVATAPPEDQIGTVEERVNALRYGTIAASTGQAIANGIRDAGAAKMSLTNTISPHAFQITTPGGTPVWRPQVVQRVAQGPKVARIFGARSPQGRPLAWHDIVIGSAEWADGGEGLSLTAVGAIVRDTYPDLIAQVQGG